MILLQNLPEIILISCDNDLHLCREYFLKNIGKKHVNLFLPSGVVLLQPLPIWRHQ